MNPKLLEELKRFPQSPGVYVIKNIRREPVYIGKANRLKERLFQHFRPSAGAAPKERWIQGDAASIEIIPTATEAEALLLESSLVKQHRPKYNIELKDDKSYPFLKVTLGQEFPRLEVARGRQSDGSVYFGPYTSAKLLRQAVSLLRRMFPLRTCRKLPKKVCLMYHIGQCHGPCEFKEAREEYPSLVKGLVLFLEGRKKELVDNLTGRMKEASAKQRYEEARLYRDQIRSLSSLSDRVRLSREGDVLDELQRVLKLSRRPERIETFDISNFQGKNPVGSMVVFSAAKPDRAEYRHFHIRGVKGINDYGMMKEVVRRRYERMLAEKKPLPDLILIDGGRAHLEAALSQIRLLHLEDIDIAAIAKKHEYLYKPGYLHPFVLEPRSAALQLLRRMRDEAHRFAIQFYRRLHRKELTASVLDSIPGIGDKRKKALLKRFRSVDRIRLLTADAIAAAGFPGPLAERIVDFFKKS